MERSELFDLMGALQLSGLRPLGLRGRKIGPTFRKLAADQCMRLF